MRNILVKCLILLTFLAPLSCMAGGLSAWEEETPYHHTLSHDGESTGWVMLSMDTTTLSFQHFYFYKGYIVASADSSQFIINEKTMTVQQFADVNKWQQAIAAQHLNPLWKREFDDCYGTDKFGMMLFLFLVPVPLFFPLVWLACVISLFFPTRKLLKLRRSISWILPTTAILAWLYYAFPQSI
ncbi:hypothetical protein ACE38W_16055 [Chitinophaga sp. Hz27]|uniref:hypothetical protein n=1 Tax=Chitinophaga sp. Hz27 TaxID=3347169 RepID=UPI0035D7C434